MSEATTKTKDSSLPDFIIVFSLVPTAPTPTATKLTQATALTKEYSNLLGLLNESGLDAVGRVGSRSRGGETVLILVRAREERLRKEVYRENLSDWLHGVASSTSTSLNSPTKPDDFDASSPINTSTRLRLVYSILTSARTGSSTTLLSSASAGATCGLSLPSPLFPHVTSIFPPHDPVFNSSLLHSWWIPSLSSLTAPTNSLSQLRDHFGETHALYFAFVQHYFVFLSFPAAVGTGFWLFTCPFHPLYSVLILGWSVVFLESWRIREKQLAVRWGSWRVEQVESDRKEFYGTRLEVDKVTGVEYKYFPWYRTLGRQLTTIPVLLLYATVLVGVISGIYAVETIVGEVYKGPGKQFLALVPTVLFAGIVPQITGLWQKTASKLTSWENHAHQTSHDRSLAGKVFALNFFVAYGSLILTAYIYIPFGTLLLPYILSLLPHHPSSTSLKKTSASFTISSSKLHTQIVAYTLTNQVVGAFTELGVPFLLRFFTKEVEKRLHPESKGEGEEEDEKEYLERVREESGLREWEVFGDYAEMVGQLGYFVLFSTIWPLGPLWSFLNNFFELRGDAFKLMYQCRRPVPRRQTSIGPWLEILSFITWFGTLTNASLVHLYRPLPIPLSSSLAPSVFTSNTTITTITYSSTMRLASVSTNPLGAIQSALLTSLLVALLASQSWFVFRGCTSYLLTKLLWTASPEADQIRRASWEMRKAWLGREGLKVGVGELVDRSTKSGKGSEVGEKGDGGKLWERGDKGLKEIGRVVKVD